VISAAKVHLTTLHGAGARELVGKQWDAVIFDEASQALEGQSWIPLLKARKVILAGDHLQLPPTVKSASKVGGSPLERTLFDRMIEMYGKGNMRMLTVQYRMNSEINEFPAKTLYGKKLLPAESVAKRRLRDLSGVQETENTAEAVVFIDTQGGNYPESTPDEDDSPLLGESKRNDGEADLVKELVVDLIDSGVSTGTIVVITPYNAQVVPLVVLSNLGRPDKISPDGFPRH
jgi:DNA polymerase alpha-associated DNA helicase A